MKKSSIIILFTLLLFACSQTSTLENNQSIVSNETEMLNIENQINDFNCDYIGYAHYDEQKSMVHSATCLNTDQVRHGGFVQYSTTGQIILEGEYSNGKKHKEWRSYYVDGRIQSIIFYDGGKLNGTMSLFDNELIESITYNNGIQHGLNQFRENSIQYENGNITDHNVEISLVTNDVLNDTINCYSDSYCFNQMLQSCKESTFEFPINQQVNILGGNQTHCNIQTNYLDSKDYYYCSIDINELPESNRKNGLTSQSFDLWIDVFLEQKCSGSFVDKVKENPDYFFTKYEKTALSKDYVTSCVFSLSCNDNHHCYKNICTPNGVLS